MAKYFEDAERERQSDREGKPRASDATDVAGIVAAWRGGINAYDIERIASLAKPLILAKLQAVPPGPERALLGDLSVLVLMVCGVAADGSRRAAEMASSIPRISYGDGR